jgi:hypothetical protein
MKTLIAVLTLALSLFASAAISQSPSPTPSSKKTNETRPGELKLSFPSLKDELVSSEVEPRTKQFRINLRFLRANYSPQAQIGHQYDWGYFPEALITIQLFQYPAGKFSSATPEEAKTQIIKLFEADLERTGARKLNERDVKVGPALGKEFEVLMQGNTLIVRTFTFRDMRYLLIAQAKTSDAGPLIQKAFDSFDFVFEK